MLLTLALALTLTLIQLVLHEIDYGVNFYSQNQLVFQIQQLGQ